MTWQDSKGVYVGDKIYVCKTNGKKLRELVDEGVAQASSLLVTLDRLYVGDSRSEILVTAPGPQAG